MKKIKLENSELVTLIDDEDLEQVIKFPWNLHNQGYAWRFFGNDYQFLHHLVLETDSRIDHKDGNKLNNQKANLRTVTHGQNIQNRTRRDTALYIGVTKTRYGTYLSRIQVNQNRFNLGTFSKPENAAKAYDKAALNFFGPDAKLNFPK